MYSNNPYMPYMQGDMCGVAKPDYMYAPNAYMPDYMNVGNMPMAANPVMPAEYAKPYYMGPMIKEKKCVKVPEVIGRNYCCTLLEQEIPFPANCPAFEIKDITKEVKDLVLAVCKDRVLINGKLHKNINYKTLDNTCKLNCNCTDIDLAYGDLRHVHVAIPFSAYVEVPGARPGDTVEVEFAGVEDSCELDILFDPCFVKGCDIPVYKKVREKVLVKVDVKVLRPCQITVDPECPNICP